MLAGQPREAGAGPSRGEWSGVGGSELTREGREAGSPGRAASRPHARSGETRRRLGKKLRAPDPRGLGPPRRPECPGSRMQPTLSDLHRPFFVRPGGRSARCDFCSFGPKEGLEVSKTLEVGALFPVLLTQSPISPFLLFFAVRVLEPRFAVRTGPSCLREKANG